MKKLIFFFAVIVLLQACDSKEYKRPRDPWVFRSVLDKQPRIVTATLNDELFVAYDARYCGLYKAWKGKVILDGPVYTTTHGPQPTTDGYAYFEQRLQEPARDLLSMERKAHPRPNSRVTSLKMVRLHSVFICQMKRDMRRILKKLLSISLNPGRMDYNVIL